MLSLRRSRLQTRIVVLSVLSTLVMLAVFSVSSVLAVRESIDRTLNERLVLAQTAADLTDHVLNQNLRYLQDVAMNPDVDIEDGNLEPERRAIRDAYFHSIFADGVYILRRDGTLIWREPVRPDGKVEETRSPIPTSWRRWRRGGRWSPTSTRPPRPTARPSRSLPDPEQPAPGGRPGRGATSTSPTPRSAPSSTRCGWASTGYSQIVDGNGIVVASGRQQDMLRESDHGNFLAALIKEKKTSMGTCHGCHETAQATQRETEVMAFAPLSSASLGHQPSGSRRARRWRPPSGCGSSSSSSA